VSIRGFKSVLLNRSGLVGSLWQQSRPEGVSGFLSFCPVLGAFSAWGQLSTGKRQKVLIKFDLLSLNFSYDSRLLKQPGSSP